MIDKTQSQTDEQRKKSKYDETAEFVAGSISNSFWIPKATSRDVFDE